MTAPRQELFIECGPGEARAALVAGGVLRDLLILRRTDGPRYAELYRGRISHIEHGIDAAFVEIGSGLPGFLPLSGPSRRLAEGAPIAVSIEAESAGGKGPRVAVVDAADANPPHTRESEVAAVLRAFDLRSFGRIVADGPGCLARVRAVLRDIAPDAAERVEGHGGAVPAFEVHGIEELIERALAPTIELGSGLRLHFGTLEALSAVDVDAASFAPRQGGRAKALAANLAVAGEIARQIRLRNLSGLILVDFIRMKDTAERKQVSEAVSALAATDPVPCHVHGFTRAGLLELTRERRRRPVADVLMEPAQPRRKSAETIARAALREAMRSVPRGAPVLVASPDVIRWLETAGQGDLAECEGFLHSALKLRADPALARDKFEVRGERP